MAATITTAYGTELITRAAQVGYTEAQFKAVTGWDFAYVANVTHRTAAIVEREISALEAAQRPAPRPAPVHRDRSAAVVGAALGLGPSAPAGTCHYCGQRLDRRGYCDECR